MQREGEEVRVSGPSSQPVGQSAVRDSERSAAAAAAVAVSEWRREVATLHCVAVTCAQLSFPHFPSPPLLVTISLSSASGRLNLPATAMVRPANSDDEGEEEAAAALAFRALARRGGMVTNVCALLGRV